MPCSGLDEVIDDYITHLDGRRLGFKLFDSVIVAVQKLRFLSGRVLVYSSFERSLSFWVFSSVIRFTGISILPLLRLGTVAGDDPFEARLRDEIGRFGWGSRH